MPIQRRAEVVARRARVAVLDRLAEVVEGLGRAAR